jgi:hypothetical protein
MAPIRRNWANFAPRFGFAWLPFGPDSKTSIRGAYGIFYNTERDYLENETQIVQPFVLNLNVVENNNPQGFVNPWLGFPGGDPFPWTEPTTAAGKAAIQFFLPAQIQRFFGPDWHTPYDQQWNMSIQRQLPWDTLVSAAYVGSKGTHLVLNVEQDPAVFIPGNGMSASPVAASCTSRRTSASSGSSGALPKHHSSVECRACKPTGRVRSARK